MPKLKMKFVNFSSYIYKYQNPKSPNGVYIYFNYEFSFRYRQTQKLCFEQQIHFNQIKKSNIMWTEWGR